MCDRYSLHRPEIKLRTRGGDYAFQLSPRMNCAPNERLPVIFKNRGTLACESQIMTWGIPKQSAFAFIARAEGLMTYYRTDLQIGRCVIPASGFYAWEATKNGKVPWYYSFKSGEGMFFAGLYRDCATPNGGPLQRYFTIIDTRANELVGRISKRMPVVLDACGCDMYLHGKQSTMNFTKPSAAGHPLTPYLDLMKPYHAGEMQCWTVTSEVNNARYKGDDCVRPLPQHFLGPMVDQDGLSL